MTSKGVVCFSKRKAKKESKGKRGKRNDFELYIITNITRLKKMRHEYMDNERDSMGHAPGYLIMLRDFVRRN